MLPLASTPRQDPNKGSAVAARSGRLLGRRHAAVPALAEEIQGCFFELRLGEEGEEVGACFVEDFEEGAGAGEG